MAAKVYTFHISYEGLEDRIWRKVEVSSNYRLDELGYLVLATFDTMAYHLFEFHYDGERFGFPAEDCLGKQHDMVAVKLGHLNLRVGSRIRMDYDFGTTQTFWLDLIRIEEMGRGQGTHYPYLLDGAGRGIIDDMPCEMLKELVAQIDRNGKTDEPFYYQERLAPWDYRWFDLKPMNYLLKAEIAMIEEGYAPLWD